MDENDGGDKNTSSELKFGTSASLKRNFWLFCIFYSIIHGAVDAVLAFSAAELGTKLGSLGGTVLYIFYTCSALLLAKPCLDFFGAKSSVFIGLIGLLVYVSGFFLAILLPAVASYIFLIGCGIGGVGAGLLWTGQGSYYTLNATYYALASKENRYETITHFAGIFAGTYLSFETLYKFIGTFIFVIVGISSSTAWQPTLFGIYTTTAFISTFLFWVNIQVLKDHPSLQLQPQLDDSQFEDSAAEIESQRRRLLSNEATEVPTSSPNKVKEKGNTSHAYLQLPDNSATESGNPSPSLMQVVFRDMFVVSKLIFSVRKLQLLIPYQICFGFSAGLVDTYVNGVIVKNYIGEGYIGVLSGLVTLSAALLATPFALIGNFNRGKGKDWIMIFGGVCFAAGGFMLLILSDEQMSKWPVIILFYILHGAARGVWENTNKAVVSEMFEQTPAIRDAAFASVYFSSGLAGALGFAFFQFLSKGMIVLINLIVSMTAVLCFMLARKLHRRDVRLNEVRQMVSALDDDSDNFDDNSETGKTTNDDDEVAVYFSPSRVSKNSIPSIVKTGELSRNPLHSSR